MKKQIGVTVDTQVWNGFRNVCAREKLRPSEPIEKFLRFVINNGSALTVLNMMLGIEKTRSEGFEAYARVLLNWYKNGQFWIRVTDETEAPVEHMLLQALRDVSDPQLRRDIQETLMIKSREQTGEKGKWPKRRRPPSLQLLVRKKGSKKSKNRLRARK
jgi:heterodisulfide reductase subunit C